MFKLTHPTPIDFLGSNRLRPHRMSTLSVSCMLTREVTTRMVKQEYLIWLLGKKRM